MPWPRHVPHAGAGFTLLELMITLVVVAVVAMIALPSFEDAIERNRVATQTNDLIAALSYARSQAVTLDRPAGLCSSADNLACGGTWQDGFIVWSDLDGSGGTGPSDAGEVLRVGEVVGGVTLATSGPTELRFNSRGLLEAGAGTTLGIQPEECEAGETMKARDVTVSATGLARKEEVACS